MLNLQDFKFFQIGLGSMGKRRIRNLIHHGIKPNQIIGFDIRKNRIQEAVKLHGIMSVDGFAQGIKKFNPDVFIISTPPDAHDKYFLYALKNKKHFFVEHPTTDKGYDQLLIKNPKGVVGVPSNSWRFNPSVKKIKELIGKGAIGKVLAFQYHMGQYLPDWHSWED